MDGLGGLQCGRAYFFVLHCALQNTNLHNKPLEPARPASPTEDRSRKMASRLTHRKRRARIAPADPDDDDAALESAIAELGELRLWRAALMQPVVAAGAFDLSNGTEKLELARRVWKGGYTESITMLREANPELVQVLSAQIANQYDRRAGPGHAITKQRLLDGMLLCTVRAQSQFKMPVACAALSVLAECNQVPREFHTALRTFFHGAVATEAWVDGFMTVARELRPPPSYEELPNVAVAVFDNLSMKLNYNAFYREGGGGEFKNMTNWFHCSVPRHLAPPGFDADEIFKRGMFRRDLSLSHFSRSFYLDSVDVAHNRSHRWTKWLNAIRNGTFLQRPPVPPTWKPHKVYEPPIFDRLQSSYEDVEFEIKTMRNALPNCRFFFTAGDGLTLMRENHLIAQKPDEYLDSTPVIIPVQGEHPHGLFHGMHCQWRLYKRFIMKCAEVLGNKQVKEDPDVSNFNVSRFFLLNILTRAVGEYLVELCRDDPAADDWDDPDTFIAQAEANINFAWLCHFLHDCAFFVLEFLQCVRGFESRKIDVLWREFFSSAHTGTAHKTQYVGMAILRAFWGQALCPELDELYHNIRSIPSGEHDGCGVGWDWAIELLNHAIKSHVDMHVSEAQIRNFIANWSLLETVQEHMREILYANRDERHWRGCDVDADVAKLKEFFRSRSRSGLGSTWGEVTRQETTCKVTLGHERHMPPWREIERVMARRGADAPHAYIRDYVTDLTKFFPWAP